MDCAPKYAVWEACASFFVAINILTHNDGIRHSGFEGEPVETPRGLLVLVACALQYPHIPAQGPPTSTQILPPLRTWRTASPSVRFTKNSHTRFCSVFCETVSDKDTLLNFRGMILPFRGMTLFLTFSPIVDDIIRTSLPKEIRLALRNHKALFYQGGLLLTVTYFVASPPAFIF